MKNWGPSLFFALAAVTGTAGAADYRLVTDPRDSARESATQPSVGV